MSVSDGRNVLDDELGQRMQTLEVLVTGGTGVLGSRVAARLYGRGCRVRILSRSGSVEAVGEAVRGNLATGEGIEEALSGIQKVVHCASSPFYRARRTDVCGTEVLLRAAERAGVSHVVFVSIVGVDRNPHFFYYRLKREAETIVERSSVPCTICRSTQFHEFVLKQIRFLHRGPVALLPRGFLLQPVDVGEVADHLVELTLGEPAGHVPDAGGPELRSLASLAGAYREAAGSNKRAVQVPLPGKAARAFRRGAQTCPDQEHGELTWEDFLTETIL